jgi:hypothetical protein
MVDNPWAALQERWEDEAEIEAMERIHGEPPQATESDAEREYAYNFGMDNPNIAWVNTPRDSWEPNPHYTGPEEPHPEDDEAYEDIPAWRAGRAEKRALLEVQRKANLEERYAHVTAVHDALAAEDNDIPF